jgi:hypothetical protein
MTYGISIQGGIANYQIDSDTSNIGFRVVNSGTSSAITGSSGTGGTKLYAIQYTPPAGTFKNLYIKKTVTPWKIVDQNGVDFATNWVELELFSEATPSSTGYGIQILNKDGILAFDSGNVLNNGATFKEYEEAFTVSGDPSLASGPLTTNLSEYATIAHAVFAAGNTYSGYHFSNGSGGRTGVYHIFFVNLGGFGGGGYIKNLCALFAIQLGSV